MKNYIFYLLFIANVFNTACSQNKPPVSIEQVPSKYSTVLFADLEKNKIQSAQFYLTFDITNNTNENADLLFPEYIYKGKLSRDLFKGWREAIPVYFNQNSKLETVFGNKEIDGLGKIERTPRQYVFITLNLISKDPSVQSLFSTYLDRMKKENKDTLHIGTISELKQMDSPILKALEGDSILISFSREDFYVDPIPIQIK